MGTVFLKCRGGHCVSEMQWWALLPQKGGFGALMGDFTLKKECYVAVVGNGHCYFKRGWDVHCTVVVAGVITSKKGWYGAVVGIDTSKKDGL